MNLIDKGYLFKASIGEGVLLACSLNITALLGSDPAARYLLHAMVRYLAQGPCRPKNRLSVAQLLVARKTAASPA